MSDAPAKTPRGWTTLYAVAFVVMLVAGLLLAIAARGFLDNLTLLWLSAGALPGRDRPRGAGVGAAEAGMRSRRRSVAAIAVLAFVTAACTGDGIRLQIDTATPTPSARPATAAQGCGSSP